MRKWILAARLRTLPLSLSGIILGSFLAKAEGYWSWGIFLLASITTILFQVLSNFANDYGDGVKGTDDNREGEARAVASGEISVIKMKRAIYLTAGLSLIASLTLIYLSFDQNFGLIILFLLLALLAIWAAIRYTVGDSAYGYKGLGDVFVFLFFGWLGVYGSYALFQHTEFRPIVLLPASAIGLMSTAVLNLNNMRDRKGDARAGKITLAIRLGKFALAYQIVLILLPWLLGLWFGLKEFPDRLSIVIYSILLLPFLLMVQKVFEVKEDKNYDPLLKIQALLTLLFAVAMAWLAN